MTHVKGATECDLRARKPERFDEIIVKCCVEYVHVALQLLSKRPSRTTGYEDVLAAV